MKRLKSCREKDGDQGFTLIEVMIASSLAAIVFLAVGGLLAGLWRQGREFIQEEQRLQEVSHLHKLFQNAARVSSSSSISGNDQIVFSSAAGSKSLSFAGQTITYNPAGTGGGSPILSGFVVNRFISDVTSTNPVGLLVDIFEDDVSKTNRYQMYAAPRNNL